ncbi:MAG: hypothetical protein KAH44_22185 [Oricola sp.]|jgi:hypothetical protein|nr:hypothetical protein [Oricola sp.]
MIRKTIFALSAFYLLGACASAGAPKAESAASLDLASAGVAAQGLRPIGDAQIPSGECGMVLWTLEGARPAAVFRFISGKQAQANVAGQPVRLVLTEFNGASGYGVFERQRFENESGVVIEVNARFGLEFKDGAYLEQGVIKVSDSAGWSMVSPAAGIAGCRP